MVDVVPFIGTRYNSEKVNVSEVICPPYDIISQEMQQKLYSRNPYNFVKIVFSDEGHEFSAKLLEKWLKNSVLIDDSEPCFYAYQQEFELNGKKMKRNSLIVALKLEEFGKGKVFPHEQTFSGPKEDRLKLMQQTKANTEAIFGLYSNGENATKTMETALNNQPLIEAKDDFGVINRIWKIDSENDISTIVSDLKDSSVFIADGHHRYETAINYSKENPCDATKYILIILAPIDSKGIAILPTHRLIRGINFEKFGSLKEKLSKYFNISYASNLNDLLEKMKQKPHSFGYLCIHKNYHLLELKPEIDLNKEIEGTQSSVWKNLAVNVLHKIVIEKILGFKEEQHSPEGKIGYMRDANEAAKLVRGDPYQLAFFLNGCSTEEVKQISLNGEKMPHKSTYFWPKQISGLVLRKLESKTKMGEKIEF